MRPITVIALAAVVALLATLVLPVDGWGVDNSSARATLRASPA